MFKLLIPSAHEVAWTYAADSRAVITDIIASEQLISCSFSNLWFYVLDYKLDGIDGPAFRFLHSIEQGIDIETHPIDGMSREAIAYLTNYVQIEKTVNAVCLWMQLLMDNLFVMYPDLKRYSNQCSYLEYMGIDALCVVFFNNVYERDVYVQQRTLAV